MAVLHTDKCGRVYTRSRSKLLWIRFEGRDGREIRKSARTVDLEEAIQKLHQEHRHAHSLTFREAAVDFFEVTDMKRSSLLSYTRRLKFLDPYFGSLTLSEIDREKLKAFVAARRRQVKGGTIRRDLAVLSSIFNHAINHMPGAPEVNPVHSFSKVDLKLVSRDRFLTEDEYQRLLEACWEDMHQYIITVACHTGMRSAELKALRKPMLHLDRREVLLPGKLTKNGKSRVVPLTAHAVRTLEKVCETAPDDLVFWHRLTARREPAPYRSFDGFFQNVRERAGLEDLRFHDLRHTFASWWVQSGGDLYTLKSILGHSSYRMVERYAHLDTKSAHNAVRSINLPHTFRTIEEE
ncbi:site-specific integrase [Psychromarinibacter sp. C21-152]|uniref:Site-specific integrase n=1 Tax=Psychromarinibacter sediminicola TaxID=3033385 RepID=A0AAE3TAU1_9RHOB|nr:site-specific integrase [Psychromarinibacter sediminicola]MDF0603577.1 site-specific integrase [Psychromarinibacter sediminicola]